MNTTPATFQSRQHGKVVKRTLPVRACDVAKRAIDFAANCNRAGRRARKKIGRFAKSQRRILSTLESCCVLNNAPTRHATGRLNARAI